MVDRSLFLILGYLLNYSIAQFVDGAGSYASFMGLSESASNRVGSGGLTLDVENPIVGSKKPLAPMAPPRVPLLQEESRGPSLGYRPPPPKLRREAESMGKCSFDSSKWSMEPQMAISGAIMFDRETGLTCEQCLEKCSSAKYQDPLHSWVCRTLTYDHKWKICDLFAVNGTEYPYFLIEYKTRDYFTFLAALPPTDAEINGDGEGKGDSTTIGSPDNSQLSSNSVGGGAETEANGKVSSHEGGYPPKGSKPKAFAAPKPDEPISSIPIDKVVEKEDQKVELKEEVKIIDTEDGISKSEHNSEISKSETAEVLLTQENNSSTTIEPIANETLATTTEGVKIGLEEQIAQRNSANNACGEDEITRYLEFVDTERTEALTDTEYTDASNRKQCLDYCDDQGVISCASAMFSSMGCELSLSRANYSDAASFRQAENVTYVEKICVPKNFATGTKKVFGSVLNKILVGQVLEVADAKSVQECVLACLKSEQAFGFVCKSAMWYPTDDDQNCLLNTENRITMPEVFQDEDQDVNVVYFEVPRADDESVKEKRVNIRFRDSPLTTKKWTRWSMCKKSDMDAQQQRYLKCTDKKDIRKCPKEKRNCFKEHTISPLLNIQKITSVTTEKTACLVIRDSNGAKRCPHGIRIKPDGKREYCSTPINC